MRSSFPSFLFSAANRDLQTEGRPPPSLTQGVWKARSWRGISRHGLLLGWKDAAGKAMFCFSFQPPR